MKRKILVMIAAIAAVLILPLAVNAASVDYLKFDKTTGTITGCNQNATGELVIPEKIDGVKVTSIGNRAFDFCESLTSITIPDSITRIGDEAFNCCRGLTSVTIPNSVTSIGKGAFECCYDLTSVTIPYSVTSIGDYAFSSCGKLNISVDQNNTSFCDISGVLFDKNKSEILAYSKDEIQPDYTIPGSVTNIGNHAFHGCNSLTSITIPDSVTRIGDEAFEFCSNLTSITIPDSVTSIGELAFSDCISLTNVTIPDSVTSIGLEAFSACGSLNISVDQNNTSYCDIDGVLFNKNKSEIIAYSKDKIQPNYTIPDSVTSIGDDAFYWCTSLTSVIIPDSVTNIGLEAFSKCTSLTSVTIPNSVTSIGELAFDSCRSLTSVIIPGSVTNIGDHAFQGCDSLTSVTISNSVTNIGDAAFQFCSSLTSVTIPDSVTSIGWRAFAYCNSLSDVYYGGSKTDWDNIEIEEYNESLLNATIHFVIKPLEVQPMEPVVDEEANTVEVPVTVVEPERAEELKDVRLYAAEYDADGHLLNVTVWKNEEINGDTVTITADIPSAAKYKLMLWDGNNVPLMDAVEDITAIQ